MKSSAGASLFASGSAGPARPAAAPRRVGPLAVDRLSDRLAAWLAAQIDSGAWPPGHRLPTEPQLAEAHGVSRTVVREAVHQLRSQGLLISRQGSGVFVAEPPLHRPLAFDPAVLGSIEAVVDVVEVRRAIEGEVAALAAQRASAGQLQDIQRALAAIDAAAAAGRDGVAEDLAFHRAIAEATGNPQFGALLGFLEQYLREATRITRGNEARHAEFMAAVRTEHQAIVAAIAAQDPAAARRAAVHHMKRAAQRLVQGGVVPPQAVAPRAVPARRAASARRTNKAAG